MIRRGEGLLAEEGHPERVDPIPEALGLEWLNVSVHNHVLQLRGRRLNQVVEGRCIREDALDEGEREVVLLEDPA